MNTLTQETVQRLLSYDPETGVFCWKLKRRGVHVGKPLGTDNGFGYLRITVCGHSYYAHRLAWLYVHGHMPTNEIDHINGKKSDNRIANLREATPSQNQQNKPSAQSNSKSKIKGVSWHKKAQKWQVHISANRKKTYLGLFDTAEKAQEAYSNAKKQYHKF